MAWRPSYDHSGKSYSSDEFRGCWPTSMPQGAPRRHMFDCELAAAAAAYTRGPYMSHETTGSIRSLMATSNNCHYYSSHSANTNDRLAANLVLRSAFSGERATLTAHQAAHIRSGAEWVSANRESLPPGFVRSVANLYGNVYDADGHKVVDGRMFRGYH